MDQSIFNSLNDIMKNANINSVTAESTGSALPDGYYLCEFSKAEFKPTKETKMPMCSMTFKIVANGIDVKMSEDGDASLSELKNTKGLTIWINSVIKDEASLKRFVSDMLKFESEPGVPLVEKDAFLEPTLMEEAVQCLVGQRIYVQVSTNEGKDGQAKTWQNLIAWSRAERFGLPQ